MVRAITLIWMMPYNLLQLPNMKTLFWKAFYKLKFGKDYQRRMTNAKRLGMTIDESSIGNLSSFYDSSGNQIRGWHKPPTKFAPNTQQHPLITKYGL